MPDLTDHFDSPYMNALSFAKECRAVGRDPYTQGMTVTFCGGDFETMFDFRPKKSRDDKREKTEWVAYFHELPKGLVITTPHFRQLADLIDPDSDKWMHHRIVLHLVAGEGGGRDKPAIRVAAKKLPDALQPMGERMAKPLTERLAERGRKLGDFEAHAEEHHPRTFELMKGKPIDEWPILAAIQLARWLRPPRSPVPTKPGDPKPVPAAAIAETVGATGAQQNLPPPPIGPDDIPF